MNTPMFATFKAMEYWMEFVLADPLPAVGPRSRLKLLVCQLFTPASLVPVVPAAVAFEMGEF